MVSILLSESWALLRACIPNGEQERLQMVKNELSPFLTIFGTAMRALKRLSYLILLSRSVSSFAKQHFSRKKSDLNFISNSSTESSVCCENLKYSVLHEYSWKGCFLDIKLRTITKVATNTRTILDPKTAEALPIMKGKGDINLLCGNCGAVLVQGIYR
jgi:hypothetical protein